MSTNGHPPIRVLIADDDDNVRAALADLVREESSLALVALASDAQEAIEAAASERPDVALVDVRMPGGGGPTAARMIRQRSPTTRVMALSASDDRASVLEMLEAGAIGYLLKGASIDQILEAVHHAARGHSSLAVEVTGGVVGELADHLNRRRREEERTLRRKTRVRAILDDGDSLAIVLQPICRLSDGRAIGAEALSRFSVPPRRGPDKWFAEARRVGLARPLELLAIKRAVALLPSLPESLLLAVNVSPTTIGWAPFERFLADAPGERIVLEITEHTPTEDYDGLNRRLARSRSRGVRVAVDDAGAGFASLRHILRLAPDYIKLDVSLVNGISRNQSQQALAAGLISFAEKSGATIIAEGVERVDELECLAALGVVYGQGYLFAAPAPPPWVHAAV
jgi:EAL domain-containing protein (putative c-di-GMP-specific phosphodiesterase class I)/CheY-like chemotaxis protein